MQLVYDIIEILSASNPDLEDALIKSQVVAHRLGERELSAWVRGELVGYPTGADVPSYRVLPITMYGSLASHTTRYPEFVLPLGGIPDAIRARVLNRRIQQSIAVIRGWADAPNDIKSPIGPELFPMFRKGIDPSFGLESAWGVFNAGAFTQILVETRARLLDFMLTLSDRLPAGETSNIKSLSKEIDVNGLFKGAVFGNGATLNLAVGTNNTANQNFTQIAKGDRKALLDELKTYHVKGSDATELEAAITADENAPEHQKQEFGPQVRIWLGRMITKAGSVGFELSSQTAAGVLAAALAKYYGFV